MVSRVLLPWVTMAMLVSVAVPGSAVANREDYSSDNTATEEMPEETFDLGYRSLNEERRICPPTRRCSRSGGICMKAQENCEGKEDPGGCRGTCKCCVPDKCNYNVIKKKKVLDRPFKENTVINVKIHDDEGELADNPVAKVTFQNFKTKKVKAMFEFNYNESNSDVGCLDTYLRFNGTTFPNKPIEDWTWGYTHQPNFDGILTLKFFFIEDNKFTINLLSKNGGNTNITTIRPSNFTMKKNLMVSLGTAGTNKSYKGCIFYE